MTLVRWRPKSDIFRFRDEMDRLFDDFMERFPTRRGSDESMWNPEVDIHETVDEVVVEAEIPGIDQKDITVSIRDNKLTLKGDKKQQQKEKNGNYHKVERTYGTFTRVFTLPTAVVASRATAVYKDGIVHLTLPKAEEAKPKEITVEVK